MSCYVVADAHIRFLVDMVLHFSDSPNHGTIRTAGGRKITRYSSQPDMGPTELGQLLLDENYKSYNARYNEEGEAPRYKHPIPMPAIDIDAAQVAKSVHCYQYQACEHRDWETSHAKHITDQVLGALLHGLPGYNDAEWGAPKIYAETPHNAGNILSLTQLLHRG